MDIEGVVEIHVDRTKTLNMGNYESEKMSIGLTVSADNNTKVEELIKYLQDELDGYLEEWRSSLQ